MLLALILSALVSSVSGQEISEKLCFDRKTEKPVLRPIESAQTRNGRAVYYSDCCPINVETVSKPTISYPQIARAVGAQGNVAVKVFVDRKGRVFWAAVESGHPLLRESALRAACRTRFKPQVCNCGKKRKEEFQTVLNFNFQI